MRGVTKERGKVESTHKHASITYLLDCEGLYNYRHFTSKLSLSNTDRLSLSEQ